MVPHQIRHLLNTTFTVLAIMDLPDFTYISLGVNEIRILDLHPGKLDEEIMVSIWVVQRGRWSYH
jgi:hypothetical protein